MNLMCCVVVVSRPCSTCFGSHLVSCDFLCTIWIGFTWQVKWHQVEVDGSSWVYFTERNGINLAEFLRYKTRNGMVITCGALWIKFYRFETCTRQVSKWVLFCVRAKCWNEYCVSCANEGFQDIWSCLYLRENWSWGEYNQLTAS